MSRNLSFAGFPNSNFAKLLKLYFMIPPKQKKKENTKLTAIKIAEEFREESIRQSNHSKQPIIRKLKRKTLW